MTPTKLVVFGVVAGTAWTSALRGYMAAFAGGGSRFDVAGTMLQIVLPGALVGGALGLAEHFRRTGGRPRWRLLALAPMLLMIAPLLPPGALWALLTTGIGGGAVAIVIIGIGGGYALSGRGPLWARISLGIVAAALAAGITAAVFSTGVNAETIWGAVLAASLMPLLAVACSIPFRAEVVAVPASSIGAGA